MDTAGPFVFGIHQLDTRAAKAKDYQRVGLIVSNGKTGANEIYPALNRANFSETITLQPGTYELVAHVPFNVSCNSTISVHAVSQYSLVQRDSPSDIKNCVDAMADFAIKNKTRVFEDNGIKIFTCSKNGVVVFAATSAKSVQVSITFTTLDNLEMVLPQKAGTTVQVTIKPGEQVFVARFNNKEFYQSYSWNYSFTSRFL